MAVMKTVCTNQPLHTNVRISVDTLNLVAKLSYEEQEELFNYIGFQKNEIYQDRYFHYSRQINNIIIKFLPRNPLTRINYNLMLIIPKNASSTFIPYTIKEILLFKSWKIKRMDIAFDFTNHSPFSTFHNRLILKSHGNVKILQKGNHDKDWKSDYIGSLKSKVEAKACCYDRNEREVDNQTGIEHDYPLRFEIRLYPKLNEYNSLNKIDYGWIQNKLSKFIFIPDIEQLPLNKWDKRKLYKVQEDYNYWKEIKPPKQKTIKKIVLQHRVPFEDLFILNNTKLFSFLKASEIQLDQKSQFTEQLTLEQISE